MSRNSSRCLEVIIAKRIKEFERLEKRGETTFDFRPFLNLKIRATVETELAFCISTANSSALAGLRFQKALEDIDLNSLSVDKIAKLMAEAGVRFAKRKAEYLKMAIERFDIVESALKLDDFHARKLLLKIKGLGMKESSHFLRNVGRKDLAILDRHILRWLKAKGYDFKLPKDYIKAEDVLRFFASSRGMSLAEFDLLIWFNMTGKVLK